MRNRRKSGSRFTFSLSEILTTRVSRSRSLPRPKARRFEDNLRLPLALLDKR